MTEYLRDAVGKGELEIGGNRSPVTYTLKASGQDDGAVRVEVMLSAPRDWLLKQGFKQDATLLRSAGDAISVHFEDTLDVDDNISVPLKAHQTIGSRDELRQKFPEIGIN